MAANVSLDELPCAVVTTSPSGRIETVNATFEAWAGLSRSTLLDKQLTEILDETISPACLASSTGSTRMVSLTEARKTPDGGRLLVLTPTDTREMPGDIASDNATREALADANALLDTIFETAPIGLGVWDRDFRFVRVNKRLAEINGVPPEDHIGKRPHEILPDIDNMQAIYARWREIFETGETWSGFEVKGATPAAPGLIRSWEENFYPIKVHGRVVNIGAVVEETTERKRNLEHVKSLVTELNHRCKNLLSIVLAIARQTSRSSDPDEFVGRFTNRIKGLVASHDLLVQDQWKGVAIADLVRGQLAPFEELIGHRLRLEGPAIRLRPSAAQGLGMAIHELATNASKYGALSNASGKVEIAWAILVEEGKSEPHFVMRWEERGGPTVETPSRSGFGQLVIGKLLEAAVHGETTITFAAEGISWSLRAPLEALIE